MVHCVVVNKTYVITAYFPSRCAATARISIHEGYTRPALSELCECMRANSLQTQPMIVLPSVQLLYIFSTVFRVVRRCSILSVHMEDCESRVTDV